MTSNPETNQGPDRQEQARKLVRSIIGDDLSGFTVLGSHHLEDFLNAINPDEIDLLRYQFENTGSVIIPIPKDEKMRHFKLTMGNNAGNEVWALTDVTDIITGLTIDPLTNLSNRRAYEEKLNNIKDTYHKDLLEMRRNPRSVGVFLIDINDTKKINDSYDHRHGDLVIIAVSQLLRDTFRTADQDLVCRIGGDEFIAFVNNIDQNQIEQISSRLNQNELTISQLLFRYCQYLYSRNNHSEPHRTQKITDRYLTMIADINSEFLDKKPSIAIGSGIINQQNLINSTVEEILTSIDKKMYTDKNSKKGNL